jgi:hypothetical protein
MASKRLRIEDIADVFSVKTETIRLWIREGLPIKSGGGRGKPMFFDRDACLAWAAQSKKQSVGKLTGVEPEKEEPREAGDLDAEREKSLLIRAQRRLTEDKRRIIRGRFLRRSEITRMVNEAVSWFRDEMQDFDRTIDAPTAIRDQIRKRMRERLDDMADKLTKAPKRVAKAQKDQYIRKIDTHGKPDSQHRNG